MPPVVERIVGAPAPFCASAIVITSYMPGPGRWLRGAGVAWPAIAGCVPLASGSGGGKVGVKSRAIRESIATTALGLRWYIVARDAKTCMVSVPLPVSVRPGVVGGYVSTG